MKNLICTATGLIGTLISSYFGGWDYGIRTLIIFMAFDYITGLIVAGVFKKSPKTKNGGLESRAGFKGLCRKFVMLMFVVVAYRFDLLLAVDYIRNAVIIGFCANEAISITENAALMGIPLPKIILNAIEILKDKGEHKNDDF